LVNVSIWNGKEKDHEDIHGEIQRARSGSNRHFLPYHGIDLDREGRKAMNRIDWLNVGREHWEGNQEKITAIIGRMTWKSLPCDMGFMQGEAIKEIIKEFKIPKVSHVADSHEMAPYGLLGIRAHYSNADIELFAIDNGCGV